MGNHTSILEWLMILAGSLVGAGLAALLVDWVI